MALMCAVARQAVRVALTAAISLGTLVLGATAASAHATLISTSPTQSASYPSRRPPKVVSVTFDEAVNATTRSIAVYDSRGNAVPGASVAKGVTTARVQALLPPLPDGTFVVVWHVVSDDGHPEQGAFTFTVGRATGSAVDIGSLLAQQSAGRGVGFGFGADRFLVLLACFVFVGGGVFVAVWWAAAARRRRVAVVLAVSGAIALGGTIASIPLQAAYTSGGPAKLFDGAALSAVLDARFGHAALWRSGLLVVFGVTLLMVVRARASGAESERPPPPCWAPSGSGPHLPTQVMVIRDGWSRWASPGTSPTWQPDRSGSEVWWSSPSRCG